MLFKEILYSVFKQKEKIEEMLLNYNSSIESYKNSIIEEGRESELNDKITEINIKQHPLIAEINQILNNLKESLPKYLQNYLTHILWSRCR